MSETNGTDPTNGTRRSDVVVIGGGLAGLTAAAYAAKAGAGAGVTLLEARRTIGGRARSTTDEHGVIFNQGAHALYRHGGGWDVLTGLGITPRGGTPPVSSKAWMGGELRPGPLSPAGLTDGIIKADLARVMTAIVSGRGDAGPEVSMDEWTAQHTRHDVTRRVIGSLCHVTSYTPSATLSADAGTRQIRRGLRGVRYLHGGWQQLVDAVSASLDSLGVTRVTDAKATAVEPDGDTWIARTADQTWATAAVVIAGTGPDVAMDLLTAGGLEAPASWTSQVPARAAVYDIALRRLPRPKQRFVLGLDQPLYLSSHTPTAELAPDGIQVVHNMRYLRVDEPADADRDRREMEHLLDVAQPGWREELVSERFLRSQLVSGGMPVAPTGLGGRPSVRVHGHPGLHVAGDWVGADAIIGDAALVSGRDAGVAAARASAAIEATRPAMLAT